MRRSQHDGLSADRSVVLVAGALVALLGLTPVPQLRAQPASQCGSGCTSPLAGI